MTRNFDTEKTPVTVPVQPYLRLIPNGIVRRNGTRILKATLTVTPFKRDDKTDSTADIVRWPICAADLLAIDGDNVFTKIKAHARATTDADPGKGILQDAEPLNIRPARRQHVAALTDNRMRLNDCWQNSLITTDDMGNAFGDDLKQKIWDQLADRIATVVKGDRTRPEGDLKDTNTVLTEKDFGDNGQFKNAPETDKRTVASILSVPHADTALALEMQRGRELGLSLGDKGVETERALPDTKDPVPYDDFTPTIDATKAKQAIGKFEVEAERIQFAAKFIPLTLTERKKGEKSDEPHDQQIIAWECLFYITLYGKPDGTPAEMKTHAEALRKWRTDNADALDAAQTVATKAALKQAKVRRFNALNAKLNDARGKAKQTFIDSKKALKDNNAPDTCAFVPKSPKDLIANPAEQLEQARVASTVGLWEKHHDEGATPATPAPIKIAHDIAGQGYFSIEASPGQARVFGLAIDVEIDLAGALAETERFAVFTALADEKHYGDDAPTPWTLTKLRRYDGKDFGWPVTLGEYAAAHGKPDANVLLPSHCIPQYDGVIVMGALRKPHTEEEKENAKNKNEPLEPRLPRYDISTLDVSTALEAEKKWLEAVEDKKAMLDAISAADDDAEADDESDRAEIARQLKTLLAVGPDYQSNGLTLLCRSAASDAIRKLAASTQKLCRNGECISEDNDGNLVAVQDAEDLTNGFRALIGIPDATAEGTPTRWRSLMGRYFRYDRSGKEGGMIETVLTAAVGGAGSPQRITLESAMTAAPARDIATGVDGTNIEAFVEEAVSSWDGTPGGVACAGIGAGDEKISDVMCFGRRSYVPDAAGVEKPPHLRTGRPYRFALQAVYAGGHAVPPSDRTVFPQEDEEFEKKNDVRARLFYPSRGLASHGGAEPYIRALRHQRIGAPSILIPYGHAKRRNGPMGFESTGKMIVRTLRQNGGEQPGSRDRSRAAPDLSQRVVVVPHLPLALATRHIDEKNRKRGIFDRFDTSGPPPGGFASVRYARGRQGFPTVRTTFKSGINGEPYIDGRSVADAPTSENTPAGEESASAVYWHRTDGNLRTDYYPDPAAETLVLRARKAAGQSGKRALLPGDPVRIALLPDGRRYPDNLPVLLSLSKTCTREDEDAGTQSTVILERKGWNTFSANRSDDVRNGGRQRCASVDLCLAPGEQFDIEMWIVPSEWRLAHDFAPVQALVQYLCNLGSGSGGESDGDCTPEDFLNGVTLFDGFTGEVCKDLVAAAKTFRTGGKRYIAPGGDILPGAEFITDFGKFLYRMMLTHPLPEIAATRVISAVHAVNVPKKGNTPVATVLPPELDPFPGKTCPDPACTLPADAARPVRAIRPATLDAPVATFADATAIAPGAKTLALTGEIELDLEKMDAIEIVASTVSPDSTVFDDPNKGRSLAHRLAGTWPGSLEDPKKPRLAAEVFGFRVARDGRVALREGDMTLLRIDGLPFADENAASKTGLDELPPEAMKTAARRIDLGPYFLAYDKRKGRLTSRRHPFPDGKARRLRIQINGLARTAEYLSTVSRVARSGDPWLQGSGLVYNSNELIPAERLAPFWQKNISKPVEVIMPATIRPAMVETKAPVPTFEHSADTVRRDRGDTVLTYTRHGMVRLRMRRGWFSSGVDERLGVVLWPPEQILGDAESLAVNRVPLRESDGCDSDITCDQPNHTATERWVQLLDFSDEDLGPGGVFVTRRGTDPVRMGKEASELKETEIFLSRASFPDLWRHSDDPGRAEFVPHALMPLSDTKKDNEAAPASGENRNEDGRNLVPPMAVGLVTYEPRFNIEDEEWYADVLLSPGRSADSWVRFGLVRYQPHTRPDLRCSRPVEQWVQPLPERRVELRLEADRKTLQVTVRGPVSRGRADEPGGTDPVTNEPTPFETDLDKRNAPRIRLRAFVDGETPAGGDARESIMLRDVVTPLSGPLRPEPQTGREGFVVKNERGENEAYEVNADLIAGEGEWKATVALDKLSVDLTRLRLKIEEIEYFLPSDLGLDEPVGPDFVKDFPAEKWREHGVRFSKVFDIADLVGGAVTTKSD